METVTKESGFSIARWFDFKGNETNLKTEIIAGCTTFATMAYMVAVVPDMLSKGGLPFGSAFTVTIFMTVVTTIAMGLYTNRPFVLGPGLGSVAIFSFTLLGNDVPLGVASGIVFISGVLFMLVSFLGVRDFVVRIIPQSVKVSLGVGIGLFIALLGFKQAGIVVAEASKNVLVFGDLATTEVMLAIVGFFLVLFFTSRNIKGGIIISVLITTLLSIPLGITTVPDHLFQMPSSMEGMMFELDILGALDPIYLPFLLAFFIPDFFLL